MPQIGSDLLTVSEDLVKLLEQSAATLATVAHRLDEEFANRFTGSQPNPAGIITRVKKLEQQLPKLRQQCQEIMSQKQELIDHARRELSSNTVQLQQLCNRSGAPPSEGSAAVYAGYSKALQDWDSSMGSRTAVDLGNQDAAYSKESLNWALAQSNLE